MMNVLQRDLSTTWYLADTLGNVAIILCSVSIFALDMFTFNSGSSNISLGQGEHIILSSWITSITVNIAPLSLSSMDKV